MLSQLVRLSRLAAQAHNDRAIDIRVLGNVGKAAAHDIDAFANLSATLNVGKGNRALNLGGNPVDGVVCTTNSRQD